MESVIFETRYRYGDDSVNDTVLIGSKTTMWVHCSSCDIDIERDKRFANVKFICHDCRKEKQREYDERRKQKKHA